MVKRNLAIESNLIDDFNRMSIRDNNFLSLINKIPVYSAQN